MTIVILLAVAGLVILVISLYRYVHARFENLADRLDRIESALGEDEWMELLRSVPGMLPEMAQEVERKSIIDRLERIEAALDPMVRARQQVNRVLRELDEELKKDSSVAYDHWQVTHIEELIAKGERPDKQDWETWIGTPFPWD